MSDDAFEKRYDFELTGSENDEVQRDLSKEAFKLKKKQIVKQYSLFRSGQSESEESDGTIEKIYLDLDCNVMLKTWCRQIALKK